MPALFLLESVIRLQSFLRGYLGIFGQRNQRAKSVVEYSREKDVGTATVTILVTHWLLVFYRKAEFRTQES